MDFPVLLRHEKYESEYAASTKADLLTEMKLVMEDYRSTKYPRVDFLSDIYNNWARIAQCWEERTTNGPINEYHVEVKR